MFDARLAIAAVFVAVLAAIPSAMAQKSAAEIVLLEGDAPNAHTVLGEVRAEAHQKAMFSKVTVREAADQQLRDQAAKLGADAVVGIKYEPYNPMTSKKGFRAVGRAVKFTTTLAAAAPIVAAPPVSAPSAAPAAEEKIIVDNAVISPLGTAPVAAAPAAPPVLAASVSAPSGAAMIQLSDQDIHGRPYQVLGEISSEAHQTSMFPKKSNRDLLDEDLRAKAARMGADAVIQIKYTNSNAMFSKKGSTAVGKAVKFIPLQPLAVPTPVAPAPIAVQPAPSLPAATPLTAPDLVTVQQPNVALPTPPVAVATIQPAPAAPVPAPAPAPAVRGPTPAALIQLSEQDAAGRPYTVLGAVTSEQHQTSMFPKKSPRDLLDEDLRAQAARLGADAVILIKYTASNPMTSKKGSTAAGVAVKFQ